MAFACPRSVLTAVLGAATATVFAAGPAAAAAGGYGTWQLSGQAGSMRIPVAGFPAAAVATTSSSPRTPSGSSAFLGPQTPFGAAFGSSQGRGYLSLRTAPGKTPSTTTLNFDSPTPAGGWGFALGDIDADHMQIEAIGADGAPLTAAQLGFRGSFNYCAASPKPGGCTRPPFTDKPAWDPATSTLVGNVADTDGAAGWFRPTVPVRSITFTFSVQSGIPVGQIWTAADERSVSGTVRVEDGSRPPRTVLELRRPDGTPVTGTDGRPLTAATDRSGNYRFPDVAADDWTVVMRTPNGYRAVGPDRRGADTRTRDAAHRDFELTRPKPEPEHAAEDVVVHPGENEVPVPEHGGEAPARLRIVDPPHHGSASVENGKVEYTPEPGFHGRDSFTYEAVYPDGTVVDETVEVTVPAPHPKPHPRPQAPAPHGAALAATGASPWLVPAAGIATALLAAGGTLVLVGRRRRD